MKKPTIFILGKLPPPYFGPSVATQVLLNSNLKELYNLVHVDTKINNRVNSLGKFKLWKPFKGIYVYIKFLRKILISTPDLVLIPNGQTTGAFLKDSIFILVSKLFRSEVLLYLRGSNWLNWLNSSSKLTQWYVKRNLKLVSGVIVLGHNLKYLFLDSFKPEQIFVVPNGADYSYPKKEQHKNQCSILFFTNHFPGKGIEDVLNAVLFLRKGNISQFQLNVIGNWYNSAFEMSCKRLVVENSLPVSFYNAKSGNEKLLYFSNADIFVFPPKAPEGHPWVIVEALAAGLPVISTDQGAIIESVHDGFNGYIVEPGNPIQIAEKIAYLIAHPDVREEMGRRSRELYEANFTEKKMVEKLSYAINEVLR
jgi:glycosyltransferase involved in cell wall biosynthesis